MTKHFPVKNLFITLNVSLPTNQHLKPRLHRYSDKFYQIFVKTLILSGLYFQERDENKKKPKRRTQRKEDSVTVISISAKINCAMFYVN